MTCSCATLTQKKSRPVFTMLVGKVVGESLEVDNHVTGYLLILSRHWLVRGCVITPTLKSSSSC